MRRRKRYASEGCLFALLNLIIRKPSKNQIHALRVILPTNAERPVELHPDELERLAIYVYSRLGYKNVKHTGLHSSTDGGVDVWMLNEQGHVEIVQCKQWRARIGRGELIEFAKVIRQQHAEIGHYWAPGGFSHPAVEYAEKNGIKIYADYGIRKLLEQVIAVERANELQSQHVSTPVRSNDKGWTIPQVMIVFGMGIIACMLVYFLLTSLF
jgi:hypothetical protein